MNELLCVLFIIIFMKTKTVAPVTFISKSCSFKAAKSGWLSRTASALTACNTIQRALHQSMQRSIEY